MGHIERKPPNVDLPSNAAPVVGPVRPAADGEQRTALQFSETLVTAGRSSDVHVRWNQLLALAADEPLEDGMEGPLSRELCAFVEHFGPLAITALESLMFQTLRPDTLAQLLHALGRLDHPPTRSARRALLAKGLSHNSAKVRDGALLGLSCLDDPAAVPELSGAIEREVCPELRYDMQQLLKDLEATQRCHAS